MRTNTIAVGGVFIFVAAAVVAMGCRSPGGTELVTQSPDQRGGPGQSAGDQGGEDGSSGAGGEGAGGRPEQGGTGGAPGAGGAGGVNGGGGTGGSSGGAGGAGGAGAGGGGISTPELSIMGFTSGGPGCPDPTDLDVSIDPTNGAIVLIFRALKVVSPPMRRTSHANCAVGISLRGVAGYQVGPAGVIARGEARLPDSTSATQTTSIYFAGAPQRSRVDHEIQGPWDGAYDVNEPLRAGAAVRSECSADTILTIDVDMTVLRNVMRAGSASATVQRVDVPIAWSGC